MEFPSNIWSYIKFLIFLFFAFFNYLIFYFYSITNYLLGQVYFLKCVLREKVVENRIEVLHCSKYFLVVNKPYDMVINSNDPNIKVMLIFI